MFSEGPRSLQPGQWQLKTFLTRDLVQKMVPRLNVKRKTWLSVGCLLAPRTFYLSTHLPWTFLDLEMIFFFWIFFLFTCWWQTVICEYSVHTVISHINVYFSLLCFLVCVEKWIIYFSLFKSPKIISALFVCAISFTLFRIYLYYRYVPFCICFVISVLVFIPEPDRFIKQVYCNREMQQKKKTENEENIHKNDDSLICIGHNLIWSIN